MVRWSGLTMNKFSYIPIILSSVRIQSSSHHKKGKWMYDEEKLNEELSRLHEGLISSAAADDTVVLYFPFQGRLSKKDRLSLERYLESLIEEEFWQEKTVDVYIIQTWYSQSFTQLMEQLEKIYYRLSYLHPYERFAVVHGFGEPTLYQAMFLSGVEVLHDRMSCMYLESDRAIVMETKTEPSFPSIIKQFRSFLLDYDFVGALQLLKNMKETPAVLGMKKILEMLEARVNFDLEDALVHFSEAEKLLPSTPVLQETKRILVKLNSTNEKEKDLALIEELYRHMEFFVEIDDVSAFLVRFYRAREAVLFFLLKYAQDSDVDLQSMKKSTIYKVVDELEQRYEQQKIDGYYGAYFYLKSLNVANALQVRNKSFIGHSRDPIENAELWYSYYGTDNITISRAKRRFLLETDLLFRDLQAEQDDNFEKLIDYLIELSNSMEKKGRLQDEGTFVLLS